MKGDKSLYEKMKREMLEAVKAIEDAHPEAGKYLREHLVFDDRQMTFKYTGDGRLQLNPIRPELN